MNTLYRKIGIIVALIAVPLWAEETETEWIEPVEGYQEETVGARVVTIETFPVDGSKRMTIAIPKASMADAENMEEIIVVGRQPDKQERQIEVDYEWVANYEDDYYGLILRFGKKDNLPIRLYLKSE